MDAAQATPALSPKDVADGLVAIEATYRRSDYASVCVVDGFGCYVSVERGALEVRDGLGPYRRTRCYDRATHGLRRLVVVNAAGTLSLEALRWCASLGIGVLVLGADGTPQLASTPRMTDDARLRRVQALAPSEPYGLDIARWLLGRKVAAQATLVARRSTIRRRPRRSPSWPARSSWQTRSRRPASSKPRPPPSTSPPGAGSRRPRLGSPPRTGGASRLTGQSSRAGARSSCPPTAIARPNDRLTPS